MDVAVYDHAELASQEYEMTTDIDLVRLAAWLLAEITFMDVETVGLCILINKLPPPDKAVTLWVQLARTLRENRHQHYREYKNT